MIVIGIETRSIITIGKAYVMGTENSGIRKGAVVRNNMLIAANTWTRVFWSDVTSPPSLSECDFAKPIEIAVSDERNVPIWVNSDSATVMSPYS